MVEEAVALKIVDEGPSLLGRPLDKWGTTQSRFAAGWMADGNDAVARVGDGTMRRREPSFAWGILTTLQGVAVDLFELDWSDPGGRLLHPTRIERLTEEGLTADEIERAKKTDRKVS